MNISASSGTVTINDNIKSISDFQEIKSVIDSMINTHKSITINIVDSISLTSSVIGYLNKLILKDGIGIRLHIGNPQLMSLLDDLNLASTFQAKRV